MNPIRTRAALAACTLAVVAAAAPAHAQRGSYNWSGELSPGAVLRVYTHSGTVTVRQASGRSARIQGVTENAREDEIRYVADRSGGGIRVCALRDGAECNDNGIRGGDRNWRPRRNSRARANFTVEVPRGVVVRVSSGNGDVTVDGATADVHAASGNGDVRVGAGADEVHGSSGNGTVLVDGARGPVHASSGNGRVNVTTASGPVNASTGNGRVEVSIASRATGDMEFSSGNGSITLTLPDDFGAQVEATTGNGSFQTDFPMQIQGRMSNHRVSGTIGRGGSRLRLSTGNGSITLRRAGS